MGKSNNIYENSYFNLNGIKVLFTECLQYGHSLHIFFQISTPTLKKIAKVRAQTLNCQGLNLVCTSSLTRGLWSFGPLCAAPFIQWNGHKNSNNLIGLSWETKGLISENCWAECWHRLINANNHYYHLIIFNFLLSCEFFPWSLVVSSTLVKIWFIVQWPS